MGGGLSFNGDLLVQEISRAVSTFAQVEWLFLYSLAVWMTYIGERSHST